jgi:hypothetical protein
MIFRFRTSATLSTRSVKSLTFSRRELHVVKVDWMSATTAVETSKAVAAPCANNGADVIPSDASPPCGKASSIFATAVSYSSPFAAGSVECSTTGSSSMLSPVSAATASADLDAGDILNSITACTLRRVPSDLYLNSSLVIAINENQLVKSIYKVWC